MSATLMNAGKSPLTDVLKTALNGVYTVRLYTNDPTIDPTRVTSDFIEATFPSYNPQTLGFSGSSTLDGNNNAQVSGNTLTFTCSGGGSPQDVYGYYITEPTLGLTVWAERNPSGPVTIVNNGDSYSVSIDLFGGALPTPF